MHLLADLASVHGRYGRLHAAPKRADSVDYVNQVLFDRRHANNASIGRIQLGRSQSDDPPQLQQVLASDFATVERLGDHLPLRILNASTDGSPGDVDPH